MADRPIRVSVLEQPFTSLQDLGTPVPVCFQMQHLGVMLETVHWTAKQTNACFSVSLFWPTLAGHSTTGCVPAKKHSKRRRRRRKNRKCLNTKLTIPQVVEGCVHRLVYRSIEECCFDIQSTWLKSVCLFS